MREHGMTKALWVSNGPTWPNGYGNQTALFVPRLKAAGLDISVFDFCSQMATPVRWHDITVLPRFNDPWGSDMYLPHMEHTGADFSIGLFDFFVADLNAYSRKRHAQWIPIDGSPARPDNVQALKLGATWVWAMSRHGEHELRAMGFDPIYVPHGVDSAVFRPVEDRAAERVKLGEALGVDLTDRFVIAMNSANIGAPSRKGFYDAFAAFKVFADAHPEAVLIVHTESEGSRGEHLPTHIETLGIDPARVIFSNQYAYVCGMLTPQYLNGLYNVADVFLHTSHGEGFGIPLIEAQMAGCPVIATDFSAMSELVLSGWKVPGTTYAYTSGIYWCKPQGEKVIEALENAYAERGNAALRQQARERALAYDADTVFRMYMGPAVQQMQSDLTDWAGYLARRHRVRKTVTVGDVELTVRAHSNDEAIAREVQTAYGADLIDYSQVKAVVDVGAHIGAWSKWVLAKAPGAQVIAVEANPANADLLVENLQEFGRAVTVCRGRCGYFEGEMVMLSDPGNTGGHTLVPADEAEPTIRGANMTQRLPYEGQRFALEEVMNGLPDYDVLKLDCEGGEFDILGNAPIGTLRRFKWIVGEYHTDLGDFNTLLWELAPEFDPVRVQATSGNLGVFVLRRIDHGS
jgi:FkbM family methyltransferase